MITNPGREVHLVAGDTTYTLYAGNRALRMIERETGTSLLALFSDQGMAELGIGTVTTIVKGLLSKHHPNLTMDDIDDIIDAAGYAAVTDSMTRALDLAMPKADASEDSAGKALEPRGTGTRSSPAR